MPALGLNLSISGTTGEIDTEESESEEEFMIATVTLTDAQIKTLPSSPVEIIPAPGANKVIIPLGGFLRITGTGGEPSAYTLAEGADDIQLALRLGDNSLNRVSEHIGNQGMLESLVLDVHSYISCPGFYIGGPTSGDYLDIHYTWNAYSASQSPVNKALYLYDDDNNGGDPYTGGAVGNTLKIHVIYQVIDI